MSAKLPLLASVEEATRPVRGVRSALPTPRALDARGFGTFHHLLVQIADAIHRPLFAESCRAFGDLVWCADLDDLVHRAFAPEATAVVVDLVDVHGLSMAPAVAAIREARPEFPIVLWCDRLAIRSGRLDDFAAAGVSAVIFRDESAIESRMLSAITGASDVAFRQLTEQAIHRRVPIALAPVVRFCIDQAHGLPRVEAVARAVGLTPRALAYQLKRSGLPPVSTLVMWSKALVASYRLERSSEPVAVIARSLGFASGSALRRLLKRCANETPQGLRAPGGFGWVLRCFERRIGKTARR